MASKHRGNKATVTQCAEFIAKFPNLGAKVSETFANCIEFSTSGRFLTVGGGACSYADDSSCTPVRKIVKGSPAEIAKNVAGLMA